MEPEGGTAIWLAMERDIPAHFIDQFLCDHKAKSGTTVTARNAGISLTESLEQT